MGRQREESWKIDPEIPKSYRCIDQTPTTLAKELQLPTNTVRNRLKERETGIVFDAVSSGKHQKYQLQVYHYEGLPILSAYLKRDGLKRFTFNTRNDLPSFLAQLEKYLDDHPDQTFCRKFLYAQKEYQRYLFDTHLQGNIVKRLHCIEQLSHVIVLSPNYSRNKSGLIKLDRIVLLNLLPNIIKQLDQLILELANYAGMVVSASKLLYFFDGKSFKPCRKEEAEKRIVESCRDAVAAEGRPSFARQVYQSLLQEPEICRDEQLHLNVVALDDCLLNLDTFQTQPHTHDLFVTSRLCASYRRGRLTSCPIFQQFLEVVSGHDAVLQKRVWQMMGYLLAPDQTGKSFFLLQGVPNSGKTVLGNLIRSCFGGDVVSALDINELGGEFALSDLVGKKLCVDFDLPADPFGKRAVSKLKKLTGGDPTSSNVKFADRVKFVNTAKLLFATNHAALIPNRDEAFFDRMVVVPFKVSVPRETQDRQLPQKLEQERDAIIVRALDAYRELRDNGYIFAGGYLPNEAVAGESNPLDAVTKFLANDCEILEGNWEPTEKLYLAFIGHYGPLCGKNNFSTLMHRLCKTLYPEVDRGRGRLTSSSNPIRGFDNLRLRSDIL